MEVNILEKNEVLSDCPLVEGSLEAKLPTIWKDGNGTERKKLGRGESQQGEDQRWRKSEERRCRCAKR